jgi:hypothetical protein
MIKKILSITTWILTAAGLLVLLGFARYDHYIQPISNIQLEISSSDQSPGFLSHVEMSRIISQLIRLDAQPKISDINIRKLESQLLTNPFVLSAAASTSINRRLTVKLQERTAMMRIYTNDDKSYYIDNQGVIFPTHPSHTQRTLIASGNIEPLVLNKNSILRLADSTDANKILRDVYKVGTIILSNDFLKALIDQIYVNQRQQYELFTAIDGPSILLGDSKNMEQKISNIDFFYKAKAASSELHHFKLINASYRNQIVCIKRDTL